MKIKNFQGNSWKRMFFSKPSMQLNKAIWFFSLLTQKNPTCHKRKSSWQSIWTHSITQSRKMEHRRLSEKNAKLWLCVTSAMGSDGTKITSLTKFTQNYTFLTIKNKKKYSIAVQRRVLVYFRSWNISMK